MIPQPTASRSVSRATSGERAVDDRASIECLRHEGYASASQIVSNPPSSIARACSRISSSGSMVSCITPMRNGCCIGSILEGVDDLGRLAEVRARQLAELRDRAEPVAGGREL